MHTKSNTATGSPRYLRAPDDGTGAGSNGAPTPEPPLHPAGAVPPVPEVKAQEAGAAGEKLPDGMKQGPDGKVQVLSQGAYKRLKDESREKGRREALDSLVRELGMGSVEELREALRGGGQRSKQTEPEKTTQPPPKSEAREGQDHRDNRRGDRDRERWQQEREALNKRVALEARQKKDYQRQLDALEAERQLERVAYTKGVKDTDYAIRLLTRALDGKSEEELAAFDEGKFFEGLRESHPYLFGEMKVAATTGTGAGGAPAPKPGATATQQAQNGATDAKKMNPQEFQELLRKRGLNVGM